MSDVNPIPNGWHSVSAYVVVPNAVEAMEFYGRAFGAEMVDRMVGPGDSTMHAEMRIGDSIIMLSDENPEWGTQSAATLGGSPVSLHLYVEDVDTVFQQALEAGCTEAQPLMDAFWGDRYGKVQDPYGLQWGIATHIEDVSPDEMERRAAEFMAEMAEHE